MKVIIISYSFTGNNETLSHSLAAALGAEHIRVVESKHRTASTIFLDILFNRTPKVDFESKRIQDDDLVIFISPVWVGSVATPLRACFKKLNGRTGPYAFVSISGGADGGNPKLGGELTNRMGKGPVALIDMHIADLLPQESNPQRKDTAAYRLTADDIKKLTDNVVGILLEKYSDIKLIR